jgi:nucleotide-binding universal stress UspA family protein
MASTFERILVGVDDSPASQAAVAAGIDLAAADGAAVVFVHVVSILGEPTPPPPHHPERVPTAAASKPLEDAVAKAAAAGVPSSTELLVGQPAREIALLAEELDADLVVVGSRQLHGVKRFVLGSTSRDILRVTTRPVLIVPAGSAPETAIAAAALAAAERGGGSS